MDVIYKHDQATITEVPIRRRSLKAKANTDISMVSVVPQMHDSDAALAADKKKGHVRKLRKKLEEFAEMNEDLTKTIEAKNSEITELKRSVQSLNEVLNSVPIDELRCNSSIASTKLLELSRKNRQLRAELETTRNRISKKDAQIQRLERDIRALEEKFTSNPAQTTKIPAPYEEMQAKLTAAQQRFFETRNKNLELQSQLKLALKRLQQEVGDNISVNALQSGSTTTNWRGRAQQILHLQQKVHELKQRLELVEQQPAGTFVRSFGGSATLAAEPVSPTPGAAPKSADLPTHSLMSKGSSLSFDRFSPSVRKTEIMHRARVDALEKEIVGLKMQMEDQRSKIMALKVRNKTLNDEMVKFKMRASSLEHQSEFNGLNVDTMAEKLNAQRQSYEGRLEEMARQLKDAQRAQEESVYKADELQLKVQNLEAILDSKDAYMNELNNIIKKLETDLKAVCGGFLFSCRELRKEEFIAILDSLEAEKNQLVIHNKTLKDRINQERLKNENLTEQLSKQRIRVSRQEARIRELEKELEQHSERKRRTQRISDYVNSVNSQMSTSMTSFVFENSAINATPSEVNEELTEAKMAELKNQLEFANEKVTMLEEKIGHLTEEKETDLRVFEQIISTSRETLLDTILGHKSEPTMSRESTESIKTSPVRLQV